MKIVRTVALAAALFLAASTGVGLAQGIGTAGYEIKYGNEYLGDREYDKAAMRFRQATQLDPANAEAYFLLAKAYLHLQRVREAGEALNRAYALDPSLRGREAELPDPANPDPTPTVTPWTGLATPPGGAGAIGTAAREMNYGKDYLGARSYDLAAMRLRQAIQLDPNHAESYFWLAGAYQALGQTAQSKQALERAYALDPSLKAHEGELARFQPVAKPAPAARPAPAPAPRPRPAANSCDDLYATCNVTATRCSLYNNQGCTTDFARQSQCMAERNACYARNGGR